MEMQKLEYVAYGLGVPLLHLLCRVEAPEKEIRFQLARHLCMKTLAQRDPLKRGCCERR